jgi:hypothetical protein
VVPDTEPLAVIPVAVSVMVAVPENDVSVCVSCHEIAPGPDESEAGPDHVPARLAGVDGGCGVGLGEEGVEPPPQPVDTRASHTTTPDARRRIVHKVFTGAWTLSVYEVETAIWPTTKTETSRHGSRMGRRLERDCVARSRPVLECR